VAAQTGGGAFSFMAISGVKLGIVQGGQLGRMLIQAGLSYDIQTHVLDPDDQSPCADICTHFTAGDPMDFDTVVKFGEGLGVLTLEYEHINVDALEHLAAKGVKVFPQPSILRIVQDKGLQKQFYKEHGIPTAEFRLIEGRAELEKNLDFLPAFQKSRRAGYDGRGVVNLDGPESLAKAFDVPSVLERRVDFEKEISVIVARGQDGETRTFPVVELEFNPEANLVELLFAPANITPQQEAEAVKIAVGLADQLNLVGVLAVEMFVERGGRILVNEIAPRAHNSGHHTIEANVSSQYEQQLRAVLGMPLGSTEMIMPAAMINLLGAPGHTGTVLYEGIERVMAMDRVYVHLYGKRIKKAWRKMGHITVLNRTADEAVRHAREIQSCVQVLSVVDYDHEVAQLRVILSRLVLAREERSTLGDNVGANSPEFVDQINSIIDRLTVVSLKRYVVEGMRPLAKLKATNDLDDCKSAFDECIEFLTKTISQVI